MSFELVMLFNHLILCLPLLLLPSIFPSIHIFSSESALHIRWPEFWSFSFSNSPSNEYSGLISFRIDWFDLAVKGTLKSLLQHHNSKVSIFWCSAFFYVSVLWKLSEFSLVSHFLKCHCNESECVFIFSVWHFMSPFNPKSLFLGDLSLPLFRSLSLSLLEDSITSFSSGCWHFHIYPPYLLAFFYSFFFQFLFIYMAVPSLICGLWDLVPWPGIEPGSPALGTWSPSPWATREALL